MPAPTRPVTPDQIRLTDEHRGKIQKSNILNRLIAHAEGTEEMSATQVTAALGLLKKALPDLQSITLGGDKENPVQHEVRVIGI